MVPFTVEEENLICMYHKSDRRRTAANIRAALPDMDEDMAALARQTADKLDAMHDATLRRGSSISRTSDPSIAKRRARWLYGLCVRRFLVYYTVLFI